MSRMWALKPREQRQLMESWGFTYCGNNGGHDVWDRGGMKVSASRTKVQGIAMRKAAEIVGVPIHEFLIGPPKEKKPVQPAPVIDKLVIQKGEAVAKPTVAIEKLTPDKAKEYLARNTRNRPIRERRVNQLVEAIQRGEWHLNNDAIAFDDKGVLLNGQHRLAAVIQSGTPVDVMVIWGAEPKSQLTMDMGVKRNLADELRIEGYPNHLALAATINVKWRLEHDVVRNTSMRPSVFQGLELLAKYPDLTEAVRWCVNRYTHRLHGSVGVMAVCYHEFMSRDADAASVFFESLTEGTNLVPGSPILLLRRILETGSISPVMQFALTIKAWNAYIDGKQLSHLVWRPVGKTPESFPAIEG